MRTIAPIVLLAMMCGVIAFVFAPRESQQETVAAEIKAKVELDRSPLAVAVHRNGQWCAVANHTASTISFVDLKTGTILREHRCGNGPADVVWIDDRCVIVSLLNHDAVAVVQFDGKTRTANTVARIPVGDEPRGIALRDSKTAFVAVTNADQVAVVDISAGKVTQRISVVGHPRTLSVSPDGRWLVTLCNVPGKVYVHDARTFKLISQRPVFDDGFNLGRPVILPNSSAIVLPHQINRTFPVHADNVEKGWVIDNRLSKLPLPDGKYWEQKQIGLDVRGRAAGDLNALALSPDGRWWVATCGGSHELLIINRNQMKWPSADPGDFVPVELRDKEGILRQVKLGGRPTDVKFLDDKRVVVSNYFANSLQVVNVADGKLERTIPLGSAKTQSLVRKGEMIFFDADRSFDSWFSCHTCHTDGHTSGQTFDTLNDGNYDTYKLVPSLRGVTKTGPWTWHGWQKSLAASVKKSLQTTLSTQHDVTDDDVKALLAYMASLKHPQSPHRDVRGKLTAAAKRGSTLFTGKAGCADCHSPKNEFSSDATYKVGLESKRYFYPEFNPPTLRGLHTRRRFLHDGRATTLEEVLTRHHRPENVAGKKLTPKELADLVAYLKSL